MGMGMGMGIGSGRKYEISGLCCVVNQSVNVSYILSF